MELLFLKKKLNIFTYFFWFSAIVYLLYKTNNDLNNFSLEIKIEFEQLFFVFIFFLILINIYSFRFFFFLKKLNKYSVNFIDWSELFFKTSLMNLFLQGSGHLLRAIELKRQNIGYTAFISINFFISIVHFLLFNIIFFLILFSSIKEEKIILLFLFILILFLFILVKKNFFLILINFIKKKINFFQKKIFSILEFFLLYSKNFFLAKNILIFFLFTLVIFLIEFFIYYIIITTILTSVSFFQIILIFILIFLLNSIPILRNLIGINELIVGMFIETLNFYFTDGAMIHIIVRVMGSLSVIVMSLFCFFLSLNKKKYI